MADTATTPNKLFSFLGSLGAILIFVLIIYLAYLPNRGEPIDAEAAAERKAKAVESLAAGQSKISEYAVDSDGRIQIPVERAMEQVLREYRD
ncbi:MAG: hypothetical protein ACLFU4_03325 [Opitutales bacterium]